MGCRDGQLISHIGTTLTLGCLSLEVLRSPKDGVPLGLQPERRRVILGRLVHDAVVGDNGIGWGHVPLRPHQASKQHQLRPQLHPVRRRLERESDIARTGLQILVLLAFLGGVGPELALEEAGNGRAILQRQRLVRVIGQVHGVADTDLHMQLGAGHDGSLAVQGLHVSHVYSGALRHCQLRVTTDGSAPAQLFRCWAFVAIRVLCLPLGIRQVQGVRGLALRILLPEGCTQVGMVMPAG